MGGVQVIKAEDELNTVTDTSRGGPLGAVGREIRSHDGHKIVT